MRGMGQYLLERISPAEQRLIWVIFVVAAVASFAGVYRYMGVRMRNGRRHEGAAASAIPVPPSPNSAAGVRDRRAPGTGKVLGKAFGSGEELAGASTLRRSRAPGGSRPAPSGSRSPSWAWRSPSGACP
jgi:hypothetical protein